MLGSVEWGTFPEWLSAVGTVGALILAFVLLNREMVAGRQAAQDRRREQAAQVSGHFDVEGTTATGILARAVITNSSPSPIYSTAFRVPHTDRPPDEWEHYVVGVLSPGQEYKLGMEIPSMVGGAGPEISFRDSAGVHWIRRADGTLDEDANPPLTC